MRRRDGIGIAQRLRGDPVLAIPAVEVATAQSKGHCQRARQRMEEGFLFDRIQLQGGDVAVRHQELSTAIEPHTTDAVQAVEDYASMTTREAAQFAVFKRLVKFT